MKHFITFSALILFAISLASCEKEFESVQVGSRQDIHLTRSEREVMQANNDFAFELFKAAFLYSSGHSFLISPLSAEAVLSMLASGADEPTRQQIYALLGQTETTSREINALFSKLTKGLKTVDPSTKFTMANSFWMAESIPVHKDYVSLVKEDFGGDVVSFNPSKGGNAIMNQVNSWVSSKTEGQIPDFLENPSYISSAMLLNALYFKGYWKDKFDPSATKKGLFTKLTGGTTDKSFMKRSGQMNCGYFIDENTVYCQFPFGADAYRLSIILPPEDMDFGKFVSSVDYEKWIYRDMAKIEVRASIPRLSLRSKMDLSPVLGAMGFSLPEGVFSGIADDVRFSSLLQETRYTQEENGVEAASATMATQYGLGKLSEKKVIDFIADRPYVMLIDEVTSGAILFIGAVTE